MAEPTQTSTPDAGGSPAPTKTAPEVDLTKLEGDQLNKVLENPNLFKLPRIAQALEAEKQLKKVEADQQKAKEQSLAEQKKWEELANEREQKNATLQKQIQDNQINSALSTKLYGEKVVDLDGALKLVDKSKISVDENGSITGVDEAISSLKTDRAYLFTTSGSPRVGNPSNPNQPPASGDGRYLFKESQITPQFYNENKDKLMEAAKNGQIEPDGPPQ